MIALFAFSVEGRASIWLGATPRSSRLATTYRVALRYPLVRVPRCPTLLRGVSRSAAQLSNFTPPRHSLHHLLLPQQSLTIPKMSESPGASALAHPTQPVNPVVRESPQHLLTTPTRPRTDPRPRRQPVPGRPTDLAVRLGERHKLSISTARARTFSAARSR